MAIYEQVGTEELEVVGGIAKSFLELLIAIAKEKNRKNDYVEKDGAIRVLLEHMKEGGEIKAHVVDAKDAKVMEACMKSQRITFVSTKTVGENGKSTVVFWYRDTDEPAMKELKEKFIYEMGTGNGYISPREFLNSNVNQNVCVKKGFDDVELEVLLNNAKRENFMVSYIESETEPERYDVIYMPKNEEQMKRALCGMAYDLAGPEGEKYRKEIAAALENRKNFDEQLRVSGDEVLVVVDTENPHNFITVTASHFTTHCIDVVQQRGLGGTSSEVIADKNTITISSYNRENLMDYVEELEHPVIMKLSEFPLIKGLSKTNEAIVVPEEDFRSEYKKIKEVLSARTDKYPGKSTKEPSKVSDEIYVYENIPQSAQIFIYEEIENNGLGETIMTAGSLACSGKDYPAVKNIMEKALYKDMGPAERMVAKLFYEHNEVLSLRQDKTETQFVVDLDFPNYVIKLTNEGMSIYKGGVEEATISNQDPNFESVMVKTINAVKNPVVLSEAEEASPDKIKIIQDRATQKKENKAANYLRDYEKHEKEGLMNVNVDTDRRKLTSRQREAYDRITLYETEEIYVDRSITEKIQDYTLDRKLQEEYRERQVEMEL